jgi:hypothetical protein
MLHRRRIERSILGLAFVAYLLTALPVLAQAPTSAERSWVIPDSARQRFSIAGIVATPEIN